MTLCVGMDGGGGGKSCSVPPSGNIVALRRYEEVLRRRDGDDVPMGKKERVDSFVTCHRKRDGREVFRKTIDMVVDAWPDGGIQIFVFVRACYSLWGVFFGRSLLFLPATCFSFPSEIPPLHVIRQILVSVVGFSSICLAGGVAKMLRRRQLLVSTNTASWLALPVWKGVVGSLCTCEMSHLSLRSARDIGGKLFFSI